MGRLKVPGAPQPWSEPKRKMKKGVLVIQQGEKPPKGRAYMVVDAQGHKIKEG